MSKIICEICGTKYPDTVEQCPICGYTNGAIAKSELEDNILEEVIQEARPRTKGGRFSKANVRKHEEEVHSRKSRIQEEEDLEEEEEEFDEDDFEDEDFDDQDGYEDDEDDDEDEGERSGVVLNILLGVVIIALLCVSGFIFVKFFLPSIRDAKETVVPTENYVVTDAPETEAPTVPCNELVLEQTDVELNEIGQMYLLNVAVHPADTTDELTFTSSDVNVVTVNEEGRMTAVSEGVALVSIVCGEQKIDCVVSVVVPEPTEATEPPTEEPTEPPTEPGEEKTVTNAYVNIRSGAGTEYEKVGEYKKGDVVTIYEEKMAGGRRWGRTDKGWIAMEYVK